MTYTLSMPKPMFEDKIIEMPKSGNMACDT